MAGPAVTAVIAAVCFVAATLIAGTGDALEATGVEGRSVSPVVALLGWVALVNLSLLLFNLIPGYPLDGGRIARAIAWWRTGDRTRATRTAPPGRGVSYLMICAGLFIAIATGDVFGGIWLAIIGLFLGSAARQSEVQNEVQSRLEGISVADVMDAEPVAVPAELDLTGPGTSSSFVTAGPGSRWWTRAAS